MEPESPSPYPQVPATCPYPEPTPSSPHDPPPTSWRSILILSSHLHLGLPNGLFPSGFPPTPCAHHYPPPYAPHALPISFVSILPPAQYWVRSTDHSMLHKYLMILQFYITSHHNLQFHHYRNGTVKIRSFPHNLMVCLKMIHLKLKRTARTLKYEGVYLCQLIVFSRTIRLLLQ